MSITVPMYGFGGVNPLNFKVVGGTSQPSNPKENMLWVNTDTAIPSYHFSATQPSNPASGDVWFSVKNSSPLGFNALKKNTIQVYITTAKQYVNGAFSNVSAKIYQAGVWKKLEEAIVYFYDGGNEYNSITGGWVLGDGGYTAGTMTKNANSIVVACDVNRYAAAVTQNIIDVTDFSKICVNVTKLSGTSASVAVVGSSNGGDSAKVASAKISKTGLTTIDVSKVTGSYRIAVRAEGANATSITFDQVYGIG